MHYVIYWIIVPVYLVSLLVVSLFDESHRSSNLDRAALTAPLFLVGVLIPLWLVSPSYSLLSLAVGAITCRLDHCAPPWSAWRTVIKVRPLVVKSYRRTPGATEEIRLRLRIAGFITVVLFYGSILRSLYFDGGFNSTEVAALPVMALITMQLLDTRPAIILSAVVLLLSVVVCLHVTPDSTTEGIGTSTRALLLVLYPALVM